MTKRSDSYFLVLVISLGVFRTAVSLSPKDNFVLRTFRNDVGKSLKHPSIIPRIDKSTPCTCGVFLGYQILSGTNSIRSEEEPVFSKEMDIPLHPCGLQGDKSCERKCMDMIISYLPSIGPFVCASIDKDCNRERMHVFTKNCNDVWKNTGFLSNKQFCCSEGVEVRCNLDGLIPRLRTESNQNDNKINLPNIVLDLVDQATDIATTIFNRRDQRFARFKNIN